MGRVVKAIAIVAAVAVVVFAPQISAALLAAIAVKSAIAAALVTTALAVGAAMALRALTAKALTPTSQGGPPQVFRQSIANSFIVYGKRRVGGLLVFFHAAESGGDYFRYFVIASAGHRCQGATQWYLNDEVVTVDGSNMVTSGPYAGAAWLWFQRGLAAETANATFVAECGGKWTTDHKGSGIAAIYAKFEMTEDVVQAGMPNITAEIEGRDEVLDTRTSLTGYTRNAALIIYDWLKIPREEGGFGAYDDEIPDDAYVSAQANVCDETVEGEPRYALDAVIATGAPPIEVRDSLILNCAGSYTYSGGKHKVRVGYFVPVSESLSEDDLAGPVQVERFLPGDVAANQVQGTFIDPAGGYQGAAFATQTASPAPTDIKQIDLDLAFITNKHQAERVAAIMLKRALAEIRVTWPMNIEGLKVEALDTVQAATSRYGLSNYAFTVAGWGLSSDFGVVLSLREENEDIYDPPTPVAPPSVPSVSPGSPINPTTDSGSVSFTPGGNISADTVQGAIEELDAEKQPLDSDLTTLAANITAAGHSMAAAASAHAQRTLLRGGAVVKRTAALTAQNWTAGASISWDAEIRDDGGWWAAGSPTVFTVPSGVTHVQVGCSIGVDNLTATDLFTVLIQKGGSSSWDGRPTCSAVFGTTSPRCCIVSPEVAVTAGDTFSVRLLTSADTSADLTLAASYFWIRAC